MPDSIVPTACILGWPINHSRSPLIHRYWLHHYGLAGDYVRLAVPPEEVERFLADFRTGEFVGGNVTVPHKETAFRCVDLTDAVASALGAVNTLFFENGALVGSNTDAPGFLANLDQGSPDFAGRGGPAIVLGAGGAARAIVWALRERGFSPIYVVNRTLSRAEALADRFGPVVRPVGREAFDRLLPEASLLVNTTSLGMEGQPALDIDLSGAADHLLVTDIVYAPLETPLLALARARGLETVDGLGMLLHQAAPGFERWFGLRPEVTPELRQLVLDDMGVTTSGAVDASP